jgi:hypothetical protein
MDGKTDSGYRGVSVARKGSLLESIERGRGRVSVMAAMAVPNEEAHPEIMPRNGSPGRALARSIVVLFDESAYLFRLLQHVDRSWCRGKEMTWPPALGGGLTPE